MKVIDMRGKETSYFNDYSIIKSIKTNEKEDKNEKEMVFLGEFLLHVKCNYEKEKHNLQACDRQKKYEEDKIITNKYEIEVFSKKINEDVLKIDLYKKIKEILVFLSEKEKNIPSVSISEILSLFQSTISLYKEIVLEYNLHYFFLKVFALKFTEMITSSNLSSSLQENYPFFDQIYKLLSKLFNHLSIKSDLFDNEIDSDTKQKKLETSLTLLYENSIFIVLRSYICNEWNPKFDSDILLDFFEKYQPIFPKTLSNQLISLIILPRLDKEIKNWDPTKEAMMVHLWVHPWLKYIKIEKFKDIFVHISKTFISALQKWHPSDKSALILIKPWKGVFLNDIWNGVINRAILPKLIFSLSELKIEPNNQNIDNVKWALEWIDLFDQEQINILIENLLEHLEHVLGIWMSRKDRNIEEIKIWIEGWRKLLEIVCNKGGRQEFFPNLLKVILSN